MTFKHKKIENQSLPAQLCAISFLGNSRSGLQQDAFCINETCYQGNEVLTDTSTLPHEFCVAVADGLAMSKHSGYVAKRAVNLVSKQWQQIMMQHANNNNTNNNPYEGFDKNATIQMHKIYDAICLMPSQYYGAATTLALVYRLNAIDDVVIKHVGDSRVYLYRSEPSAKGDDESDDQSDDNGWRAVTQDHSVLNDWLQQEFERTGVMPDAKHFNADSMASSLSALTECLLVDVDMDVNPMPNYGSQTLRIQAGDAILVCSDGIHDLVKCEEWQVVTQDTDLQDWLKTLKRQVYASKGKAYDNGTAVLIRF